MLYTLFSAERPKTIPCPAACPHMGHIREYPRDKLPTESTCTQWQAYCIEKWTFSVFFWWPFVLWIYPLITHFGYEKKKNCKTAQISINGKDLRLKPPTFRYTSTKILLSNKPKEIIQ